MFSVLCVLKTEQSHYFPFFPFWGFEICDAEEEEEDPSLFLKLFFLRRSESMDFQRHFLGGFVISSLVLLLIFPSIVIAGDIVHHDDYTPKKPGCENDFILVIFLMAVSFFALEICVHLFDLHNVLGFGLNFINILIGFQILVFL